MQRKNLQTNHLRAADVLKNRPWNFVRLRVGVENAAPGQRGYIHHTNPPVLPITRLGREVQINYPTHGEKGPSSDCVAGMTETGACAFIEFGPGEGGKREHVHVVEIFFVDTTAAVQVAEVLVQC